MSLKEKRGGNVMSHYIHRSLECLSSGLFGLVCNSPVQGQVVTGNHFMHEQSKSSMKSVTAVSKPFYRFQWEGTTGLIKVIPSKRHDVATTKLNRPIYMKLIAMGLR
ncbi:uncharacterized protein N7479_004876 [Penicillium vulpinum]|uniref:uncharacterized protein n=1 Tax=Penicillium vulpinum TaxID=29845 RepID=UPI002549B269|nr:uncharacterized protein N7479_004876 [Penicillium vulpinum]KAJ5965000.1 hypothetical protein N7479_004876 [Penicillium vulpinum]